VKLVIHAGFPNTGAWAFQAACAEARSALAGVGVCYPDLVETGSGRGHADLAAALARDDFDAVDRLLGAISMQGIVRQCRVVLLSAEEFSGPDLTAERLERLRRHARECFDAVELVVLVRSPQSLAYHAVRQALPHFGFAFWNNEGHAARLAKYAAGQQDRYRAAAGPGLREVDYDALAASARFCNGVLQACVPELPADIAVLPERWGNFDAPMLDPYAVFAPLLRAAIAKAQGANPYAASVQEELERVLPREALRTLVAHADMARISTLLAGAVEAAVAEAAAAGWSTATPR
jgi:hypothetical protein